MHNQPRQFIFLMLCLLTWFAEKPLFADDAPNETFENKLSKSFKRNSHPLDGAEWNMLTDQLSEKSYTTHKGETLRDVSEVLFGDPNYWPKIWSLNTQINDPFELPAGTMISLRDGTVETPPELSVYLAKEKDHPGTEATAYSLSSSLNAEIPTNTHEKSLPLKTVPHSLPGWNFRRPTEAMTVLNLDRPIRNIPEAIKNLEYYATESKTQAQGEIVGTEMGLAAASEFQYIYVHFKNPPQQKMYSVVRDLGKVESTVSKHLPMLTQVMGLVEVLEKTNSRQGLYRAIVRKSLANVEVGALLQASPLPTYSMTDASALGSTSAQVVGGHFDQNRFLFAKEGIVFLDQGRNAGLAEGQGLWIYRADLDRPDGLLVRENLRRIGKIKIIKLTEHFATAVVLSSSSEIKPGDRTTADAAR